MRLLVLFLLLHSTIKTSFAEYQWGFGDVSLNALDWNQELEKRDFKRDFSYIELEGGAQFDWGDLYGFFDLEQPDRQGEDQRSASKGVINYYLGSSPFSLYGHVFSFNSKGFSEQNRVFGFGYRFLKTNFFFKPFFGYHSAITTFFSGHNGFMAGWFAMYMFNISKENFRIVSWHESEFDRAKAYAAGNGNNTSSLNGALSLWWDANKKVNYGVQYRYARDKLGSDGTFHAWIYTLRFNL